MKKTTIAATALAGIAGLYTLITPSNAEARPPAGAPTISVPAAASGCDPQAVQNAYEDGLTKCNETTPAKVELTDAQKRRRAAFRKPGVGCENLNQLIQTSNPGYSAVCADSNSNAPVGQKIHVRLPGKAYSRLGGSCPSKPVNQLCTISGPDNAQVNQEPLPNNLVDLLRRLEEKGDKAVDLAHEATTAVAEVGKAVKDNGTKLTRIENNQYSLLNFLKGTTAHNVNVGGTFPVGSDNGSLSLSYNPEAGILNRIYLGLTAGLNYALGPRETSTPIDKFSKELVTSAKSGDNINHTYAIRETVGNSISTVGKWGVDLGATLRANLYRGSSVLIDAVAGVGAIGRMYGSGSDVRKTLTSEVDVVGPDGISIQTIQKDPVGDNLTVPMNEKMGFKGYAQYGLNALLKLGESCAAGIGIGYRHTQDKTSGMYLNGTVRCETKSNR